MGTLREAIPPSARHLCIDMQRLFSAEGPWPTPWMERVEPLVVALVAHAPRQVIFTRFMPPPSPAAAAGRWRRYYARWREVTRERLDPRLLELVPALQPFAGAAELFDKPTYSAFLDGRLARRLAERGAGTLILSGAETDVCVLATALGAVDYGFRVVIASDALCSSSDQGHDSLLALFATRFTEQIETATVEEIIDAWHPE